MMIVASFRGNHPKDCFFSTSFFCSDPSGGFQASCLASSFFFNCSATSGPQANVLGSPLDLACHSCSCFFCVFSKLIHPGFVGLVTVPLVYILHCLLKRIRLFLLVWIGFIDRLERSWFVTLWLTGGSKFHEPFWNRIRC